MALALVNLTLKNKRRYGGYIVHFAIVLIFVGLTGNAFNLDTISQIKPGEEFKIGKYTIRMVDYKEGDTPNYRYGRVSLQALKDGKLLRTMVPEKRIYKNSEQTSTTEVELNSTLREDLYVIFAGMSNDGQRYEIHAFVNPLVFWVWFGSLVMVIGTLVCLLPDKKGAFGEQRVSLGEAAVLEETVNLK
jgi:cytochrome c-type biogenesis protein CcmF